MSIHGDVADLGSSCHVSLSGLNLDRLPPHPGIYTFWEKFWDKLPWNINILGKFPLGYTDLGKKYICTFLEKFPRDKFILGKVSTWNVFIFWKSSLGFIYIFGKVPLGYIHLGKSSLGIYPLGKISLGT